MNQQAPLAAGGLGHEPADVFISYKREERDQVETIAQALRELGLNVWFDARLDAGTSFDEEINREVRAARAVLVLWSPDAVTSEWVRAEASIGRARNVLVPAFLRPCELYPPFNLVHTESLEGFVGGAHHKGWRKIVAALGKRLDRPGLASYLEASARGEAALWAWARRWPGDPLAAPIWDAEIASKEPERGEQLREERARLLAALTEAAPEAPAPKPAKEKRIKATRPRRQGGYVMLLMLVTLVVQMLLQLVWTLTTGALDAGLSSLWSNSFFLVLPVLAVGGSGIAGVLLKRLWPLEGSKLSFRRATLVGSIGIITHLAAIALFFVVVGVASEIGRATSPSGVGFFVLAALVALFFGAPAVVMSHLIAILLFAFSLRQLRHNTGWTRPSWPTRAKVLGSGALASLLGLVVLSLVSPLQSVDQRLAVELRRLGYDTGTYYDWDEQHSRFVIRPAYVGTASPEAATLLQAAIQDFRSDYGIPQSASRQDVLARARSTRTKLDWRVNQDGSEDVTTIGEALRRAAPGATIYIAPGEYAENLEVEAGHVLFQASGVTLTGRQDDPATEADENPCGAVICIRAETEWQGEVSLAGLEVRPSFPTGAIRRTGGASITLADMFIYGSEASADLPPALDVYNTHLRTVRVSNWQGAALFVSCSDECELADIEVTNAHYGLVLSGQVKITNARLNNVDIGTELREGARGFIENSAIDGARLGLYAVGDAPVEFRNNRVSNVREGCIWLSAGSNAIVRGNRFARCGTDGYYPIHVAADATGIVEDNVVLASRNPIVFVEPGSTAIVRNNRDRD